MKFLNFAKHRVINVFARVFRTKSVVVNSDDDGGVASNRCEQLSKRDGTQVRSTTL